MFLDLAAYKRKVSRADSIASVQDTLIALQGQTIRKKDGEIEAARSAEKQANFKAVFFEGFAAKQQDLVVKTLQKQNRNYAIGGVLLGVLVTLLLVK